jgi:hypothetical protein
MDFVSKLRKFMKFICEKYESNDVFRSYGAYPWPLIEESGINFGDGRAQLSAMEVLLDQGLIEVVENKNARRIQLTDKIRPSFKGLNTKQKDWSNIISAITEGITKGIIKGFR